MNYMIGEGFMTNGINIVSLVFAFLILLLCIIKGKTSKFSSKVFLGLVIMTVVEGILLVIAGTMAASSYKLTDLFGRFSIFTIICWNYFLIFYISIIFKTEDENKSFKDKHPYLIFILIIFLTFINVLGCSLLDFKFVSSGENSPYLMGGQLYSFAQIIAFFSIFYAVANIIYYRSKLDKFSRVLGMYTIVVCLTSMLLKILKIVPVNDTLFLHSMGLLFFYLSLESRDAFLLDEFTIASKKASESNKLKSDFIMNMSHQLRTPLTSVLGFSDSLINDENLSIDVLKEDSNNIYTSSKKLLNLVNSIIDISKLESNKESVHMNNYSLDTIIYDISSNINSYIDKNNLIFTINVDEECPNDLVGDDKKINKILNILLMTSVDFTDYGEVSLNISSNMIDTLNHEFKFHIKNSGHALSIDTFNRSLDDLIKLSSDNDSNIDEKTLNLIVAKSLIDLIGANIEFINETGKGTQFIITLKQKLTSQNVVGNIKEKIQTKRDNSRQIINLKDKKVLIVDDKKISMVVLQRLFAQYNVNADTSVNPREALDLTSTNNYDVIFVENNMKDMSGKEFINKLNSTGNRVPPVIGIINKNDGDTSDYFDVIEYPIEFKNLNNIINKLFVKGGSDNEL